MSARLRFSLLSFLGCFNLYTMRVNFSIALVSMSKTFEWNESSQSLILSSFFYGYILTQFPGGRLAEFYGGKWFFGFGVLFTSILTYLTPFAAKSDYKLLIAVRILEGLLGSIHKTCGQQKLIKMIKKYFKIS